MFIFMSFLNDTAFCRALQVDERLAYEFKSLIEKIGWRASFLNLDVVIMGVCV